jgi:hypothetical protein
MPLPEQEFWEQEEPIDRGELIPRVTEVPKTRQALRELRELAMRVGRKVRTDPIYADALARRMKRTELEDVSLLPYGDVRNLHPLEDIEGNYVNAETSSLYPRGALIVSHGISPEGTPIGTHAVPYIIRQGPDKPVFEYADPGGTDTRYWSNYANNPNLARYYEHVWDTMQLPPINPEQLLQTAAQEGYEIEYPTHRRKPLQCGPDDYTCMRHAMNRMWFADLAPDEYYDRMTEVADAAGITPSQLVTEYTRSKIGMGRRGRRFGERAWFA